MDIKDISKKVDIKLNSKPEKTIAAVSLSTALAILTIPSRKKKGKPNFFQRVNKYYSAIDKLLCKTVAKDAAEEEKRRLAKQEFSHKKMRDMEIIDAIPIDLSEDEKKDEGRND